MLGVYDRPDILAEVRNIVTGEFGIIPDDFEASVLSGVVTSRAADQTTYRRGRKSSPSVDADACWQREIAGPV